MLLKTLGCLELDPSPLSKPQPLVALCYLALEGDTSRAVLGELFWPDADTTKRSKSLNMLLADLKTLNLVKQEGTKLAATVSTDAQQFLTACQHHDLSALGLYRGGFLPGLEMNKRLALSEPLKNWLLQKRAELHTGWLELRLQRASQCVKQAEPKEAARLTWQVYKDAKKFAEPDEVFIKRVYALLLESGDRRKANELKREAQKEYGIVWETGKMLPALTPTFTGRDEELNHLKTLLLESKKQLVTITGLGGVGKTALALRLAKDVAYYFTKVGVVLLENLLPSTEAAVLLAKIATVLELELPNQMSLETVTKEIADQSMLLLLDNAEQRTQLAPLLTNLLESCPHLQCLVTSREPLNLSYEQRLGLQGLHIPPSEDADFNAYGASRLLLELCALSGANVSAQKREVLELCRLTEGLPLALHLVAPWSPSLPLSQLIKSMRETMLASHGTPDAPTRHKGLQATFDTSFRLLPESQQQAFISLAVFAGKFSFTSVAAIMELSVSQLRRFVETSLLRFSTDDGLYDLHSLVRHYALSKSGQLADTRAKHTDYYLEQLGRLAGDNQEIKRETRQRLAREAENVFAAWHQAALHQDTRLYDLIPVFTSFCEDTNHVTEGLRLLDGMVADGATLDHLWTGRIRANQSWLEHRLGNTATFQRYAAEALELLKDQDADSQSTCYIALGVFHHDAGKFEKAKAYFQKDAELHPATSGEYANALLNLALVNVHLGEYKAATSQLDKAQKHIEDHNKPGKRLQLANVRSQVLLEMVQALKAQVCVTEVLEEAEHEAFRYWLPLLRFKLARGYFQQGETDKARQLALTLLGADNVWVVSLSLLLLGDLAADALQRRDYYLESLVKIKKTRSVPALLLRFVCLAEVTEDKTLATKLLRYCSKHMASLSFVDRSRLVSQEDNVSEGVDDWDVLEPYEVASLLISELKQVKTQLETSVISS